MKLASHFLLLTAAAGLAWCGEPAVKFAFVGDVMLDTLPGKAIAQGKDPFAPFAAVFQGADVVVGNLECMVGRGGKAVEDKPYTFRASPEVIPVLARHFTAVSVANNHSGDFGKDGFVETLDLLSGKVPYFGGGRNLAEAHRPLIVERQGLRVALLGYNEFHPREFEAGPGTPGVAWSVDRQVVADITAARAAGAALIVTFMHWGQEGEPKPTRRQRRLAHRMVNAGADLVIGAHPHCTQGTESYKGRLIVYSLGNFVFDGFTGAPGRTGWLLRVSLDRQGHLTWDTLIARIDDEGLPQLDLGARGPSGQIAPRGR